MFSFNRHYQVVSEAAVQFIPPPSVWNKTHCSKFSQTLGIISHFNFSPSAGEIVITHCGFNLYLS